MTPLRLIQRTLSPINEKKQSILISVTLLSSAKGAFPLPPRTPESRRAAKHHQQKLASSSHLRITQQRTNHRLPPQNTIQLTIPEHPPPPPRPQIYPRNPSTSVTSPPPPADPTQALPRTGQALLIPSAGPANHTRTPWGTRQGHDACVCRAVLLIYGRGRVCMAFSHHSQSAGFVFWIASE